MATLFLEPGGDATFDASSIWTVHAGTPAIATDFVHGGHIKSIKYRPANGDTLRKSAILGNSGRFSFYIYINAYPSTDVRFVNLKLTADGTTIVKVTISNTGVVKLFENSAQIGSNGSILSTGTWYRLCLAWNLSSTTVNSIKLFKDGVVDITVTNATLTTINPVDIYIGNKDTDSTLDFRSSDHYIDDSNAMTDPGNIWVTAKRPNANGSVNNFTTQIGAGGSGYGTGHSPQVNERALSTTNGWSMIGAGSAVTEEYSIENSSTGDIDISTATIVDFMGWIFAKAALSETGSIIVANVSSNVALTSTNTMFIKIAGSTTYPAGNTDIGIITATTVTTVSLYEAGIIVAYIPAVVTTGNILGYKTLLGVGI